MGPLFITGVATFLVCFTLPFILLGVFLIYNLCQRECMQYKKSKMDLLPPNFLQSFDNSSTESIDSLFNRTELRIGDESMKTFGVEEYISTKYFTPFDHKNMSNGPANPKMGCTIVTKLANSRPGQNKKHSQDGCSTGNGSVQSVQSYSAGSDTDYK